MLKAPPSAAETAGSIKGDALVIAVKTSGNNVSVDQDEILANSPARRNKGDVTTVETRVVRALYPEASSQEVDHRDEGKKSVTTPKCGVCLKNFDGDVGLLSCRTCTTMRGQRRLPLSCRCCNGLVCYCYASTAMVNKLYEASKRDAIKNLTGLPCPLCKKEYGFYFGSEPIITHPERFGDLVRDPFYGLK
jgi:hypothetical protein